MEEFYRLRRLPPYVFAVVNELKYAARHRGEDIIDFGMGNPDQPTPQHIVDKMVAAVHDSRNHRYSLSVGIGGLRRAICAYYKRRFDVDLDPVSEAIVTIGSKEGFSHLAFAMTQPGDTILVPNPTYPIHVYSFVLAGADILHVPLNKPDDFFASLKKAMESAWPRPKAVVVNFPSNPTAMVVDLDFYEKMVAFAEEYNIYVISDIAYSEICFDGYRSPSMLQVKGAKNRVIEFYTLSKTYNMPGWRVGFALGNPTLVRALARIKSYLDYGMFQPIQIASTVALNGPQDCVDEIRQLYQSRRDVLVEGLNRAGWEVELPLASMFVWARIPEPFVKGGSLEFAKRLLKEAKVAVSPGIGFGQFGDSFVRIALIENEHRTRQAVRNIRRFLNAGADVAA
ncbi:MAG: aminotransferase class I/II-fold pyridoxal phosphate-dependent enzyme [Magnetococcales bacterium]|nr:aminotransferase class I/II-fold pyridoxal phosphate-dependent enzyme [Magnetococcales bacterium]MBF0348584.1 aminotransferase class I/II-fold pyridoxal phosphate-dependent enzyme [Magnetococcales bacterium]MBF0631190.1 aminotransferase class I/II-fold pyridoxal phosphate-dependent enzyme [Magnetococcales bacterium]